MLHLRHLTRIYRSKNSFIEILRKSNNLVITTTASVRPCRLSTQNAQEYSTTTRTDVVNNQPESSDDNILKRVLKRVGFSPNTKTRLRVSSHLLYESVADKINYLNFFKAFDMPNTFNSWFLVTELHVWMLLVRAMAEGSESGEDGRFLRNCIVEVMWGDVNARAKKLGTHNPSKTREQIEILSEQFQAALIAYDEGIMSDDRVLAGALWRRFFAMNCDDIIKIERLVKYVREQTVLLDQLQREDFLQKPKIAWADLEKITV
ncbi:PREDICTED: ubiquinol-cytochrome-c reductase complex assembly factor 1 isoform X1 [Rhagoletis zephyria]|uniref:ubiquinol-cytochrome-c reductase complex assembly factor 1 n=1 Tax=Rhagoletis pomonella TaxID=28610 RepID=UPI0008117ED8|nr:PREDICTED: ubiquinol-cytochrome-c reductase complex assembly factor 1 isoform X1 [Rhagoletis zephyria]XP_017493114.1 PREDICTED: ubiquinol-cytochrome-c reductase complex assembly factor 1 isoform X2 [Rhagoletis zephyria]XP_017493115.1 PREDICTED: ubiquinol-cytochrome-c reductase complex assembly factor 1 isoform X1 [Rhagoletis zephyria]XP_036338434.1 ubiquinol-cytochrome-c reductase complex assembly factor 1 [Rhagoletis pomonella]